MANLSERRQEVLVRRELREATAFRPLADQAFSRAAGAPLISGNRVRLLKDAAENYPAWLEAIGQARRHIHFESYILHEDTVGRQFADALISRAQAGVRVRLIYDWLGGLGKSSAGFWSRLREGGVEVRCFNPPHLDAPLGWLSRDHRKMLAVDGEVGFVTGLCVGQMWVGDPQRGLAPWRDTGVEIRGPAVAEIERAFANVWEMTGEPIPEEETLVAPLIGPVGTVSLRIVASAPATSGMFRLDQMVTALARHRVWLSDAYYAGAAPYVQALRAAAKEGVDVRLLVPSATDLPLLQPLSRAGYRPLLEAGIRIFEWNGTMMHAKTAVVDGRWARVGSTNLNLASWLGNCELDAVIEDEPFAQQMEAQYLQDLEGSTEIVLSERRRLKRPRRPAEGASASGGAGAVRAAAGAVRIGHALGAAFTNHRVLEPVEARLMVMTGLVLLALGALFAFIPWLLIYPLLVVLGWVALAFLYRGIRLYRQGRRSAERS
ncbi:MAG: phospholipase D-like domain-containing protein [Myxococcota bacterium]|nr:phospholipase D-like domain-containing protein [Myxococcota bacterium]